jgi:antitoxin component YwqK of YwqJK toxin-antitoxin module
MAATTARGVASARMGIWGRLFGKGATAGPPPPRAGELQDGKREGVWVEDLFVRLTGSTYRFERTFRAGVLNGPFRAWLPGGTLHETGTYFDGEYDGVVVGYHPNGAIANETSFARGKLHGLARAYDAAGAVTSETEYREGKVWTGEERYGKDGRGRRENGKKVGIWEKLGADGRIDERGMYVDGARHGPFELRENGWESWHGEFAMGERVGIWELRRDKSSVRARGV